MTAIESSKTHRLYILLKERILSGEFAPGHRLPSEPQLAEAHEMSRVTIRRALHGLARDGLIDRQPGSGTFVRDHSHAQVFIGDLSNMMTHLVAMGRATGLRLLAFNYITPPDSVAKGLKLATGERVQHSLRVRLMDGEPFSYLSTYVPERIGISYAESDLAAKPLLELLEQTGVGVASASQTISATLAGPDAALALGVATGAPLISLTRLVFGRDGRGVEYLNALYRPDKYQFHMEMTRTGATGERQWKPLASAFHGSSRRAPAARRRI